MSEPTSNNQPDNNAANVDLQEIAKFEALAARWWDPESEFRPLHDINPLRLNYIDERVSLPGKRAIDVGCGGGLLTEGMARRSAIATGIDLGEAPLAVARLHAQQAGIEVEYLCQSAERMAAEHAASFDLVTCLEMLEHVPDPTAIVKACADLAKPGGQLFFSTINRNPKSFLFAIVGAEYVLNLLPRGTHEYTRFIRPSELAGWCRAADLDVVEIVGMSYNPLTHVSKLTPNVSVNYLLHARKAHV
jgi:2-polyprenyl-6-hydroxyphenyl methylase/3-demethylubiquinone-9 3-methyltransferase